MAKFDKEKYAHSLENAKELLGLRQVLDNHNSNKLSAVEAEQLPLQLAQTINKHIPKQAQYTDAMVNQYASQDPTLQNLLEATKGDLEDLLYAPESEFQKNVVSVLPDKISEEYKKISENKEAGPDDFYVRLKVMARTMDYLEISADKINAPESVKKALKADSDPKNSEAIKKEIIDSAVKKQISALKSSNASKESIASTEHFLKKSYMRRFNEMKDDLIGEYLKEHSKELGTYLANASKTLVDVSGKEPIEAGKQALEHMMAYETIGSVYSGHLQKHVPIYRIDNISYEDMGLKPKAKKEAPAEGLKQAMGYSEMPAATA